MGYFWLLAISSAMKVYWYYNLGSEYFNEDALTLLYCFRITHSKMAGIQ